MKWRTPPTLTVMRYITFLFLFSFFIMSAQDPAMPAKNVLGESLEPCCYEPMTGFWRDGYCRTGKEDRGTHVVCAIMTEEFLAFTKRKGNDLSTPNPAYRFPGLKQGDKWCLCILRWLEAERSGVAPPIVLASTDDKALEYTRFSLLEKYAYKKD